MDNFKSLHIDFLRSIAKEPYSVDFLRKAIELISERYHICGVEAEFIGSFHIAAGMRDILVYESETMLPAGEPLRYTFHISEHRNILIYMYPGKREFDEDEKEELEIYAANVMFYLELVYLEKSILENTAKQELTGVPNASGYLYKVTELMKRDIPLRDYSAFYFNLKDFGEINKHFGREIGDELLRLYSKEINGFIGKDEIVGHLGGDNFMALVKKERQQEFIDKLVKVSLSMRVDESIEEFEIAATMGVWDISSDVSDPGEVISRPLAEELGMDVLCEGVERDDQLALLNSVGCYVIQGYYYDRPLPHDEFEARLRNKIYQ